MLCQCLGELPKPFSESASNVSTTKSPEDVFDKHPVSHYTFAYALKLAYEEARRQIVKTAAKFCTRSLGIEDERKHQFGVRHDASLASQEICSSCTTG